MLGPLVMGLIVLGVAVLGIGISEGLGCLEMAPHIKTGAISRPWGSLDNRLKAMCVAVQDYADGLVEIAHSPN